MVTLATQWQNEFELHARAILGLPVDTSLRNHGASAVIYGGHDAGAMRFDGVAEALAIEGSDVRLFGKPESFVKRRMGVALVRAESTDEARVRAKVCAATIKPRPDLSRARCTANRTIDRIDARNSTYRRSQCAVYNAALRASN